MKIEWKKEYRTLIEELIRYGNAYAYTFRKQRSFGTDMMFSASQIQVLEYILEAEETDETMTQMANRLGVSKATFSKNVKCLVEKGLLEKYHREGNNKSIYVKPTKAGKELYNRYAEFVTIELFDDLFRIADTVPKKHLKSMEEMLAFFADRLVFYQDEKNDVKKGKLIKIE